MLTLAVAVVLAASYIAGLIALRSLFTSWPWRTPFKPPTSPLALLVAQLQRLAVAARAFLLAPRYAALFVMAAWSTFLLAPGTAFADTGSDSSSSLTQTIVTGLVITFVAPAVLALVIKYAPAAESKINAKLAANPFFQRHSSLSNFAQLFVHMLDGEIVKLAQTEVAVLKRDGKFDAQAGLDARNTAIAAALDLVGQNNRDALAKQLGFDVPAQLDAYLNGLAEKRLAALKAAGIVQSSSQPAPAPVAAPLA